MTGEYQQLMSRVAECEALAEQALNKRMRRECSQLANEYRRLARRMGKIERHVNGASRLPGLDEKAARSSRAALAARKP